jgi:replicative DNA helicase
MTIPIANTAERAAISLLVSDPNVLTNLHWDASYFFQNATRIVFDAIQAIHSRTGIISAVAVISELETNGKLSKVGGQHEVMEMIGTIFLAPGPVSVDVADEYRQQLIKAKSYRDAIKLIEESNHEICEMRMDLGELSEKIAECVITDTKTKTIVQHVTELVDDLENKNKLDTFKTGLYELDMNFGGGFHRGEMVVVGAQTSGGKSILLYQIALEALIAGKSVAIFSLEMPSKAILRRMAANMIGKRIVNAGDFGDGTAYVASFGEIASTLHALVKMPLTLRDDLSEVGAIDAEAQRLAAMNKADVIIVDYLQIVSLPNADNREQAISELTRRMKLTALKTQTLVLTASQLNDDGKLRESRAIGHHADHVLNIIHDKNGSSIFVEKNRRGQRGISFPVVMRGDISKFEEGEKQDKKKK